MTRNPTGPTCIMGVPALLNVDAKPVEIARARHIKQIEKKIVFGQTQQWADTEADEVDLGKEGAQPAGKVKWDEMGTMGPCGARQACDFGALSSDPEVDGQKISGSRAHPPTALEESCQKAPQGSQSHFATGKFSRGSRRP